MFTVLAGVLSGVIVGVWGPATIVLSKALCGLLLGLTLGLSRLSMLATRPLMLCVLRCTVALLALAVGQQYGQQALTQALSMRLHQSSPIPATPISTTSISAKPLIETPVTAVISVTSLSDSTGAEWRQVVQVETVQHLAGQPLVGQRWLLSLPYPKNATAQQQNIQHAERLRPNTRWRVQVRLKPIHGQVSMGAFDVERWLLSRNIHATGTLLSATPIAFSSAASQPTDLTVQQHIRQWTTQQIGQINRLRLQLREHLATFDSPAKGVLLGLLTGDRALIDDDTQALYQQMGISHLLAISGPHVLLAATVLVWLGRRLLDLRPSVYLRMERRRWLLPLWLLAIVGYALLAGWELPAQRTVWMAVLVALLMLFGRRWSGVHVWLCAACGILLFDPLAVLSAGFWLSFGAVALLMLLSSRERAAVQHAPVGRFGLWDSIRTAWRTQLGITVLMLPLVLAVFGQFSWLSVPVNLLAIPLLGVVVVGLNLLAFAVWLVMPTWADALWSVDLWVLSSFHQALTLLARVFPHALQPVHLSVWPLCGLALGIALLWLPRGVLPRGVAWASILLLALLVAWPARVSAPLLVHVLDVGQGLSVLIQTPQHSVLFDTGAKRPDQRVGMGERVVLPALSALGVHHLDMLMISHADNDHAGGATAVLDAVQVAQVYGSQALPDRPLTWPRMQPCQAGTHWTWDGVDFNVLAPWPDEIKNLSDNDQSCVLKVTAPADARGHRASVLLTGDAGHWTENMLALLCADLNSDLLILGHHGSKNSSGAAFLRQVAPQRAVVSAGFMNRYGHPAAQVINQLNQQHIIVDSTITSGTLRYTLGQSSTIAVERWRDQRRWWQNP